MTTTIGGTTGITFPDATTQNTSPYTGGLAFRNRIINGAMMIDQRNAGAEVNPAVSNTYYLDRWNAVSGAAGKFKIGQNAGSVTPPTGFTYYAGLTSLSAYSVGASEAFGIQQRIEGYNVADLGWGTANAATVTLSFWVRSSLTGTFGGSVRNSAADRSYPFTYTIGSANTWEQKSVTIAGDTTGTWLTTSGIGMSVLFSIGAGSSVSGTAGSWAGADYRGATGATSVVGTNGATFYITGVQLEKGNTATSFDYRPYGTELALCQRYYERLNYTDLGSWTSGMLSASNAISQFIPWKVTKRGTTTGGRSAANAVNLYSGGTVTSTAVTNNASPAGFALDITIGSTISTFSAVYSWPNSSWFDGSAEL